MGPVAQHLHSVMSICHYLPYMAGVPVMNGMAPGGDVVAELLRNSAVVDYHPALDSGGKQEGVDSAVRELVDGERDVAWCQRRLKLVESRSMTSVISGKDRRL